MTWTKADIATATTLAALALGVLFFLPHAHAGQGDDDPPITQDEDGCDTCIPHDSVEVGDVRYLGCASLDGEVSGYRRCVEWTQTRTWAPYEGCAQDSCPDAEVTTGMDCTECGDEQAQKEIGTAIFWWRVRRALMPGQGLPPHM
jgi:hypothetical protein